MSNENRPELDKFGRPKNTRRWRELRARAIRRNARMNGGVVMCEKCGKGPLDPNAMPGSTWAIDVDHREAIALGGDAFPKVEDLRVMCPRCNRGDGRRIALEKADATRVQTRREQTSPHGFFDHEGRWNRWTRAWT